MDVFSLEPKHKGSHSMPHVEAVNPPDAHVQSLERILRNAIETGYHTCDESVAGWDDPRGGCSCWVEEAKIEIDYGEEDADN